MWFKNIQVYSLGGLEDLNEEKLEKMLNDFRFSPCGKTELSKSGWSDVFEDDSENKLTRKVDSCFFLKLRTENKIIPNGVVKERLKEKIKKFKETNEGKTPKKDVKEDMKMEILMHMAETAFSNVSDLMAYIDLENKQLFVNAGSAKKAEELISYIRMTLGSFEAVPLEPPMMPFEAMSQWVLNGEYPNGFFVGHNVDLKDLDGASVSVKKYDLGSDEVINHIKNGMQVTKLEMNWQNRINFILTDKFEIKSIKPEDRVSEGIKEDLGESSDFYAEFQASMFIMVKDFNEMIQDLLENS